MRFWRTKKSDTAALKAGDAIRGLAALSVRPVMQLPDGDEPPTEFRIFAVGVNETEKGPFLWDEVAASLCMAFYQGKKVDLSMDWEHQALAEPPIQAPASAWWTPEIRDGELWATNIRWTPDAAEQIRKKEYRYFSPAFTFDAIDADLARPKRIINVALTNIPAMDAITPLVAASANAADTSKEIKDMEELKAELASLKAEMGTLKAQLAAKDTENADLKAKLSAMGDEDKEECRAVGLRFDAPRSERRTVVAALTATAAKLREATGQATDAGALATVDVWKGEHGEVVKLRAELTGIEERTVAAELKQIIDAAEAAGKMPPAEDHPTRKSVMTAFLKIGNGKPSSDGIAWLRGHVETMPVIAAGRETSAGPGVTSPEATRSASLDRHAALAGVKPESIKAAMARLSAAPSAARTQFGGRAQ